MEEFQEVGSGWAFQSIEYLTTSINKFAPLHAGTYIPLPKQLLRKGILNIKNNDQRCFIWCILANLYPASRIKDCMKTISYPQNCDELLNLINIDTPVKISTIPKFEKQNASISINVFGVNNKDFSVYPLYNTKAVKNNHINLLYFKKNVNSKQGHYCLITDLGKLISRNVSKSKSKHYVCNRCLNHFTVATKFHIHTENCNLFAPVKIETPDKSDAILKFSKFKALIKKPFVIYADFECLTKKIDTTDPSPIHSFTNAYQTHLPYSCAYVIVCSFNNSFNKFNTYRGIDPVSWLLNRLKLESENIYRILVETKNQYNIMSPLTEEQKN